MFQRNVRFHVNITPAGGSHDIDKTNGTKGKDSQQTEKFIIYAITFTLISGKLKPPPPHTFLITLHYELDEFNCLANGSFL